LEKDNFVGKFITTKENVRLYIITVAINSEENVKICKVKFEKNCARKKV
jgi:hypothetical protein